MHHERGFFMDVRALYKLTIIIIITYALDISSHTHTHTHTRMHTYTHESENHRPSRLILWTVFFFFFLWKPSGKKTNSRRPESNWNNNFNFPWVKLAKLIKWDGILNTSLVLPEKLWKGISWLNFSDPQTVFAWRYSDEELYLQRLFWIPPGRLKLKVNLW